MAAVNLLVKRVPNRPHTSQSYAKIAINLVKIPIVFNLYHREFRPTLSKAAKKMHKLLLKKRTTHLKGFNEGASVCYCIGVRVALRLLLDFKIVVRFKIVDRSPVGGGGGGGG